MHCNAYEKIRDYEVSKTHQKHKNLNILTIKDYFILKRKISFILH